MIKLYYNTSTFFENTKNMDFYDICVKEFLQLRNLFNEKKIIKYQLREIFPMLPKSVDNDIKRIIQKHFPNKKVEKGSIADYDIEIIAFNFIISLHYYDLEYVGELTIKFRGLQWVTMYNKNRLNHFNGTRSFDRSSLWVLEQKNPYFIAKSDPKINFIETFDDGLGYIVEHLNAKE